MRNADERFVLESEIFLNLCPVVAKVRHRALFQDGKVLQLIYALNLAFMISETDTFTLRLGTLYGRKLAKICLRYKIHKGFALEIRINGFLLFAVVRRKVQAQYLGYGGGKLLVVERAVVFRLAQLLYTLSEGNEPCILRTSGSSTMSGEVTPVAPTMIASEQISGLALVEGVALAGLHDATDEIVGIVGCPQIFVVLAGVGFVHTLASTAQAALTLVSISALITSSFLNFISFKF